jgi:large subunit ribosomal protein L10
MKMRKEDKAALVDEIADRLGDAEAIFAVDYRGITVPQAAELRAKLTEAEATFRVVKNRLAKRATERAGTAELDRLFEGPTALAFVKGDAVTAAKAISTFGRQHDILEYKGGLMDGAPLDPDQFRAIARLPGLDVLRGQLVAVVASPLTGLTRGLASMLSGLAVALGQIQEQGLVGGGAEVPAEEPKPTEEEPAEELKPTDEEPVEEAAEEEPAGASDEVAHPALPDDRSPSAPSVSEPAAPPEPEPAGNGAEGEASGGDVVVPEASGGEQETSVETDNDDTPEESEAEAKDSSEPDSEEEK